MGNVHSKMSNVQCEAEKMLLTFKNKCLKLNLSKE